MKVIKKVLWVLLCITIFNIVFGISAFMKFTSMMGINGKLNYTLTNEAKENLRCFNGFLNSRIKLVKSRNSLLLFVKSLNNLLYSNFSKFIF